MGIMFLLFILFFMCLFLIYDLILFSWDLLIYTIVESQGLKELLWFSGPIAYSIPEFSWMMSSFPAKSSPCLACTSLVLLHRANHPSLASAGEFPTVLAFHAKGWLLLDRGKVTLEGRGTKSESRPAGFGFLRVRMSTRRQYRLPSSAIFLMCLTIFILTWLPLTSVYQRLNNIVSTYCH